jgi:hypothetical protein
MTCLEPVVWGNMFLWNLLPRPQNCVIIHKNTMLKFTAIKINITYLQLVDGWFFGLIFPPENKYSSGLVKSYTVSCVPQFELSNQVTDFQRTRYDLNATGINKPYTVAFSIQVFYDLIPCRFLNIYEDDAVWYIRMQVFMSKYSVTAQKNCIFSNTAVITSNHAP